MTIIYLNQLNAYDRKSVTAYYLLDQEIFSPSNKDKKILFIGNQCVVSYLELLTKYEFSQKNIKIISYDKAANHETNIAKYDFIILGECPHKGIMTYGENSITQGIEKEAKRLNIYCLRLDNFKTTKESFENALANFCYYINLDCNF